MTYPHLKLWTRPDCYMGPEWKGWYVVYGQNRDSDALRRSNFHVISDRLTAMGALDAEIDDSLNGGGVMPAIQIIRDSHWAVGWVEFIYVHKDAPAAVLKAADEMLVEIEDYPILNEDHFCELEWTEATAYWASVSVRQRAEMIQNAGRSGVSIFAARRSELPSDDNGQLMEMLR
jgi:hypothetical protein